MIDWDLVRRIAKLTSGESQSMGLPRGDLPAIAADSQERVLAYTQLSPATVLPPAEMVTRDEWIEANLRSMRPLLELLDAQLGGGLGPLGRPARLMARGVLSAQVGGLTGFLAQRVLGQYDMPLLDSTGGARLLLVGPNVRRAATQLGADSEVLLRWVTVHEMTHAVQFSSVPWLRLHLGSLLREILSSLEIHVDTRRAMRLPSADSLRELVNTIRGGEFMTLAIGRDRRVLLDRVQATMAVIEGHAEHVMDAVGAEVIPSIDLLRAALERRRMNRAPVMRIVERLLGFELKLRQYRDGKRFCDHVVQAGGIETLNRVWRAPEALPTLEELANPDAWIARTAAPLIPR